MLRQVDTEDGGAENKGEESRGYKWVGEAGGC